jgi:hypothetical protein
MLNTEREHIRIYDPAINVTAEELVEFSRSRDASKLRFHDGMKPMRFKFRRLKRSEVFACEDERTDARQAIRAFSIGVTRVEDYTQGKAWEPAKATGAAFISDADLDAFAYVDLIEIGSLILEESRLSGPLDVGSLQRYRVQPLSLDALSEMESRRAAEQSLANAAQSKTAAECG